MKKVLSLIILGFINQAWAFKTPDIVVDSKLDYNWSSFLISKFRVLAMNYGQSDPFKARFDASIDVTEASVGEFLSRDSQSLMTGLGNAIGLNITNAQTKVKVHGFSYDLKGFKTDLKASEVHKDGLVLSTDFSASALKLSADKVTFSLVVPVNNEGSIAPVLEIEIRRPSIRARQDRLINFYTKLKIQDSTNHYKLKLQKTDFSRMADNLLAHPEDLVLEYDRIIVPEVSVQIGKKLLNFSPDKIEKVLRERHEAIKGILIAQVASSLKKEITGSLAKIVNKFRLEKEHWLGTKLIKSQLEISQFTNSQVTNHIEVQSAADFCTIEKFNIMKQSCLENKITQTSDTRLNQRHYETSLHTMKSLMENGEANIVASISEDYLNKLLVTTYDAGLWKEALDEAGVELGPRKVIMRMDRAGDSGTLIMDVVYRPKGLEKIATGANTIRFPLVLEVSVRIEKHDEEPVVIVRLNDVDLSDDTLLRGKPEHNILSTISAVPRFKNKVVRAIKRQVISLKNKDIVELRYPELRGLGLEHVDFMSDGHGRMNAMMRLEDLIDQKEF